MNLIIRQQRRKNDGDKSMIKLLKSPAFIPSRVTTIFLTKILMNCVIE